MRQAHIHEKMRDIKIIVGFLKQKVYLNNELN